MKFNRAVVVPFSSVVGSSVTLHDPVTGAYVGQLGIIVDFANEARVRVAA